MWMYCLCLVPWGWMADKIGTRRVNSYSVLVWSIGAILTSLAVGLGTVIAAQLVLGLGESASLPTAGKVVRQWFPAGERGLATAIFSAGMFAGPSISSPIAAWFVVHLGWRLSFVIFGSFGFAWLLLWLLWFRLPRDCGWLPEAEREYLVAEIPEASCESKPRSGNVGKLLSRKTTWGLLLTQGTCGYTLYLYLYWLPSYLIQARHMNLMRASWFISAPYLIAAILSIAIGRISDRSLRSQALKQGKRRIFLIVCILLSSAVIFTNLVSNEFVAIGLIAVSLTSVASALSLNMAITNDLVRSAEMSGTALGIVILGGNLFGLTSPIVTGSGQDEGGFDGSFYLAGALLLSGAVIAGTMTKKPLSFADELS